MLDEDYCVMLCMKVFGHQSTYVMLQEAEKKNGVGMALDVATFPLILIVRYIVVEFL